MRWWGCVGGWWREMGWIIESFGGAVRGSRMRNFVISKKVVAILVIAQAPISRAALNLAGVLDYADILRHLLASQVSEAAKRRHMQVVLARAFGNG